MPTSRSTAAPRSQPTADTAGDATARDTGATGTSAARSEGEIATELVFRIGAGDIGAEAELVERYGRGLRLLLRRLCRDRELAEDLFQHTFYVVLERLRGRGLTEPAALVGFLRGTARNLYLNESHKTLRRRTDVGLADAESRPQPSLVLPAEQLGGLLRSEKVALVRRLIGEMSTPRDRQVLYRTYLAEQPTHQICADLGLEPDHLYRVLHRARQRLKKLVLAHRDAAAAAERPARPVTVPHQEEGASAPQHSK